MWILNIECSRAHQVDHIAGLGASPPGTAQPPLLQRVEGFDDQGGRCLRSCKGDKGSFRQKALGLTGVADVQVWDAASRRCLFSMSSHTKAVSCVRWSGEGHIISSARDCSINVWSGEVR